MSTLSKAIAWAVFLSVVVAQYTFSQKPSFTQLDIECHNRDPLSSFDSTFGPYPEIGESATDAEMAPDFSKVAYVYEKWRWPGFNGVAVYDMQRHVPIAYIPGVAFSRWSPDGRKLLTNALMYDVVGDSTWPLPVREDYQIPHWSPDGRFVYYSTTGGWYRSTADGKDVTYLGNFGYLALPVGDSLVVQIPQAPFQSYKIWNLNTLKDSVVYVTSFENCGIVHGGSISKDARFIASDFWERDRTRFNGKQFLGLFDLQQNRLRKVLPAQALGNDYYPSWTTRGTLLISYVCRLDSTYTVWEIDTNGNFLRQWVGLNEFNEVKTGVSQAPAATSVAVHSIFPQPGHREITVTYTRRDHGLATFSVIDISGKVVRTMDVPSSSASQPSIIRLDTEGLPPGCYVLSVSNNGNAAVRKSFILDY
jgi:hypothetical protein